MEFKSSMVFTWGERPADLISIQLANVDVHQFHDRICFWMALFMCLATGLAETDKDVLASLKSAYLDIPNRRLTVTMDSPGLAWLNEVGETERAMTDEEMAAVVAMAGVYWPAPAKDKEHDGKEEGQTVQPGSDTV